MAHPREAAGAASDDDSQSGLRSAIGLAGAWEQFYVYCIDVIVRCPAVRKLSPSDREDCVQEVMMELVSKFGNRRPEKIKTDHAGLIRTLSRNKAVDMMRRRYSKPESSLGEHGGDSVPDRAHADDDSSLTQGESISLVWESLLRLDQKVPVTSYLVFYLHTIEGWEIPEIVELFGMTGDQVRSRCHQVKTKFAETLRRRAK